MNFESFPGKTDSTTGTKVLCVSEVNSELEQAIELNA
jgi:hypothetical protein